MNYLLSVDGGGTKTEFYLSDLKGNLIDTFTTGSTSIKSVGTVSAYQQLKLGVQILDNQYGVKPTDIAMSVFGMSGCDSAQDYELIQDQILQLGFIKERIYLCNDGVLAFYAQTQEPGMVVIAGTGSIVIGIDRHGEIKRLGGWGYHFSDVGSGYWIGCEILKRTLFYCDDCHPYDPVFEQVKDYFAVDSFAKLPYTVTEVRDTHQVAGLAFIVADAARLNNELCLTIMQQGAGHLADQVAAMAGRMGEIKEQKIVYSGGVLKSDLYQELLTAAVRKRLPGQDISFLVQRNKPSYGGILLARRQLDKRKEIVIQIFTGGYLKRETTYELIEQKLRPVLEQIPVTKVIIGWCIDESLYQQVKQLVHQYQAQLYLWLPVFSENGLLLESGCLQDFKGQTVSSYQLKEGENFEFYCPNQKQNRENVKMIYQQHFSGVGFDGVFLDKIRYASFANGISGVFSCFCPECQARYREKGLDVERLQVEMQKVLDGQDGYDSKPLNITGYQSGSYLFKDPVWPAFFNCKAEFIGEALTDITGYFRDQGLAVGMDVLAPFLSYFTGQQMPCLKALTDFMKPMMYRITNAPAGLPFEYESLLDGTTTADAEQVRDGFDRMLGIHSGVDEPFDLSVIKQDLELFNQHQIPVHCGIEINRIADVAPVDPAYIKATMQALSQTGINGFVLSWDLLSAPADNIEAVYQCVNDGGEMQ